MLTIENTNVANFTISIYAQEDFANKSIMKLQAWLLFRLCKENYGKEEKIRILSEHLVPSLKFINMIN